MVNEGDTPLDDVRLDVWLDVACVFRTRSEAQTACKAGKVNVNGQSAKPNRRMRAGDVIEISRPFGRKQRLRIVALAERHVARAEARKLYEDLTPPPTAQARSVDRRDCWCRLDRAGPWSCGPTL